MTIKWNAKKKYKPKIMGLLYPLQDSRKNILITGVLNIILIILPLFILSGCAGAGNTKSNIMSASKNLKKFKSEIDESDKIVNNKSDENEAFKEVIFAMDTLMELTAYGPNAKQALSNSINEIKRLDSLWSVNDEKSEISILNKNKQADLSEDTTSILQTSLNLYAQTGNAFNIAILPIVKAWGFTTQNYKVPSDRVLKELLSFTHANLVKLEGNHAYFENDRLEIDFAGIAKGYTSNKVMEIFKESGVTSGIVSLGGNVHALGTKTDGTAWKVAVQDPLDPNKYIGVVNIVNKAVITSGTYQRYFEYDGKAYHHIIDPETGKPAENGLISVTIVASDGTMADGISTSLFVMGLDRSIEYWRARPEEFDAILINDDRQIYITENLQNSFSASEDKTAVHVIEK